MVKQNHEQFHLPLEQGDQQFNIAVRLLHLLTEQLNIHDTDTAILQLLEELQQYAKCGVRINLETQSTFQQHAGLELLFTQIVAKYAYVTPIPFKNVLVGSTTKRGKFSAKVREQAQLIGLTWQHQDETFAQAFERAEQIRQAALWLVDPVLSGRRRHFDLEPLIGVVNEQQLRQWQQSRELLLPLQAYRKDAPDLRTLVKVVQELLEHKGLQERYFLRICALNNREVEVMFVDQAGHLVPLTMMGIRLGTNGKKHKPERVDEVVGLKLFESTVSETHRLEAVRGLSEHFRTISQSEQLVRSHVKILSVTPELLELWQAQLSEGTDVLQPAEPILQQKAETDKHRVLHPEHVLRSQVKSIRYLAYERSKPGIGAKPSFIVVDFQDGTSEQVCLDFGSQREDYYYNSLFDPSIQLGMEPFREILPSTAELPTFYRLTLLLKTAEAAGAAFLEDYTQNADLIDLFLTLTAADFKTLLLTLDSALSSRQVQEIMSELEQLTQDEGKKRKLKHIAFLISHFHDDHIGFAGLVGSHIPQVIAAESAPWREHFFNKGSWMDEISIRRHRKTAISEKSDEHFMPPQHVLQPYETRFVGRGKVSITSLPCDHSIYGATMFLIAVYDDFGLPIQKILYTGDYRLHDTGLTEKSIEFLIAIGGVDTIITETTNVRPAKEGQTKSSILMSKETLHENYDHIFQSRQGKVVVCQIDPKDLGLIELITGHAMRHHFSVAYGMKHSEPIELFRQHDAATALAPATVEHQQRTVELFNAQTRVDDQHWLNRQAIETTEFHPRPGFSEQTRILVPQKTSLSKSERRIIQYHPDQMIEQKALARQSSILLFVRPTSPLEEELANIAPYLGPKSTPTPVTVLRAHYFTYQDMDKELAWRNQKFCRKLGWEYITDLVFAGQTILPSSAPQLRLSGHSKAEDFFATMEVLLAANPDMRIIPVHGNARRYVGQELQRRFGESVEVLKQMDKGKFDLQLY